MTRRLELPYVFGIGGSEGYQDDERGHGVGGLETQIADVSRVAGSFFFSLYSFLLQLDYVYEKRQCNRDYMYGNHAHHHHDLGHFFLWILYCGPVFFSFYLLTVI